MTGSEASDRSDGSDSSDDRLDEAVHCSRKGCTTLAQWVLVWNNPKVHTPERRKTWVACDEHRAYLTQFLDARGFMRETVPFAHFSG